MNNTYRVTVEVTTTLIWDNLVRPCPLCGPACAQAHRHVEVDLVGTTTVASNDADACHCITAQVCADYEAAGWEVADCRFVVHDSRIIIDPEKLHAWTHGLPIRGGGTEQWMTRDA